MVDNHLHTSFSSDVCGSTGEEVLDNLILIKIYFPELPKSYKTFEHSEELKKERKQSFISAKDHYSKAVDSTISHTLFLSRMV